MTIIYSEPASPDFIFVKTEAEGARIVLKLQKSSIATALGIVDPTFRALSDAVAERIDEITVAQTSPACRH